jgi:hypothetical protein
VGGFVWESGVAADQFDQLRILCTKFDTLRSQRNPVIHAYRIDQETTDQGTKFLRVTVSRQLKVTANSLTIIQLDSIALAIAGLGHEIRQFMLEELEPGYFA